MCFLYYVLFLLCAHTHNIKTMLQRHLQMHRKNGNSARFCVVAFSPEADVNEKPQEENMK